MSITRLAIRQAIAEETGLGFLVTATDGSTTTLISSAAALTGPMSSQRFGRGSPIRFSTLAGAASTETTFVDSYAPNTGTITLSPAVTAVVADDIAEIWAKDFSTVDRIDEAIDRGLQRHCLHWVPIPLTDVPDGDMGDSAITDLWTASVSTVTKVSMSWPGSIGQRYLRVLNAGYAASNAIPCQAGDVWPIDALVYVAVGTGTLTVYDDTNAAAITLSGDGGSYTGTGWKRLSNTFTVPSGCETLSIRLGSTGATDDTYWTSVVAHPQDRRRFTLPARVLRKRVGDVLVRRGEEYEDFRLEPYVTGGREVEIGESPVGITVQLSSASSDPVYVEELRPYEALTTDTATTECADELAIKAGIYEVYKGLAKGDRTRETKSGYLTASDVEELRQDSLRDLKGIQYLSADDRTVYR